MTAARRFRPLDAEALRGKTAAQMMSDLPPDFFLRLQVRRAQRAVEARTDIKKFFEFVMREETKRTRIKLLPHQRVGLDFIMAHERSVNMWPVGTSKTFAMAGITMYLLGQDVTARGAFVSATQGQAAKPVGMVRDYIESSAELRMVFPHLAPSSRKGDSWTQTEITVDRPPGIRDPSLIAVGIDGGLPGARLSWVVVDDILDRENTATKEQRDKTYEFLDSMVLSRLDRDAKIVVTNTAWHPDDLVHRLEALGWATLRMDVLGNIEVKDDVEKMYEARAAGRVFVQWDTPDLRPATPSPSDYTLRLTAHDPDPKNEKSLWPDKYSAEYIAKLRRRHLPHRFNQLFRNICRDDASARCKSEWIEACKEKARKLGVHGLVQRWRESELVFTGVDLAVGLGEEHDLSALFTFAVLPGGYRRILDIDAGRYDGPTIIRKLTQKHDQYGSVLCVENNAAQQYLIQFARAADVSLPLREHTTGRAKAHPEYGVEGLFIELYNGAWLIPNDKHGNCPPEVQAWVDDCLNYMPAKHTPDRLMASYFAREEAKRWGVLTGSDTAEMGAANENGSLGMSLLAR